MGSAVAANGAAAAGVEEAQLLPNLSLFSDQRVHSLFESYMDSISTKYPIIHSKRLKDIHSRREKLTDPWEVAVLHLVYAIGGRCLELASPFLHKVFFRFAAFLS